ncbi:MAG TPA: hypothetical protein VK841_17545 [Polyangiaceae bacterium]|jgi:AAA family ATP:ADP antiporter|nr:hypothetical protein [Polyangiaceae bacterium]
MDAIAVPPVTPEPASTAGERLLSRLLRPFARIEPDEAVSAIVLCLIVFSLLAAYYLLKTAREPLILLSGGGAEMKQYASAGQAALLVVVVRAYASVARHVGRVRLLASVYLFFASNLLIFAALATAGTPIGVPFYLWVGVFNYTSIAQFWAYAADSYTPERGARVFAILGIGSSVGAVAGARFAKDLIGLGPQALMLTAAGILVLCVALLAWVDRRLGATLPVTAAKTEAPTPAATEARPFDLLFRDRYLLLIAGLTLILNWVNASGEYILDRTLLASVHAQGLNKVAASAFIGAFKGEYFAWVNATGTIVQLFAVSRIMRTLGVRNALLFQPAVSLTGYALLMFFPSLSLIRIVKVGENSIDYSLQNTARQSLYLVTSRLEKYVGKTTVDTLFVRLGDVLSAVVVYLGSQIGAPTRAFAALNVILIAGWGLLVFGVGREQKRRENEGEALIAAEPLAS